MKNIYIVRHGQSTANAMLEGLHSKEREYMIDCKFSITQTGIIQSHEAGKNIANLIKNTGNLKCNIYVSPYERTRQTAQALKDEIEKEGIAVKKCVEDPRIVEQDFGDFDFQYRDKWKDISPHSYYINQQRYIDPLGRFFARLENGENLLDVYNRISLFVTTRLERDMETSNVDNFVIVTHGNTMRVIKMFLLDMKVEEFSNMSLPKNGKGFYIRFNEGMNCYSDFGEF